MSRKPQFDEIGYWSEVKLDILEKYASAYSRILSAQKQPQLFHVYIDAFAGAGIHVAKRSQDVVDGSPQNALNIEPPFRKYFFIDIAERKVESLAQIAGPRPDVAIYQGDCNKILLDTVFPEVRYEDYRRGLCVLDPYGLDLNWSVISSAGQMRSLEVFVNFPVMDINRNVLWHDPEKVDASQIARMNAFWGDESWRDIAYRTDQNLFRWPEKQSNDIIAEAFRDRLRRVAKFASVPAPLPMRNSRGATVYYLFFASQKSVAEGIVLDIFRKYESREKR
jgi:three-Cys-motif partner protein